MYIGLDFGTTNSGAAVFDGQRVRVFLLDPASQFPAVMRSLLYITREHQVLVGKEAIDTYYRQNVGRATKMVQRYVGEIEMTFAEIGTFIRDVHVLVDELMPGRLLRSLKSGLATDYEGTTIFGQYYSLEELIATYLRIIRQRIESTTDEQIEGIVLGHPVNFVGGTGPADNQRALERLRRAAEAAGFSQVHFELEPVAAALDYELSVAGPQNIAVFDFGGGTLDITIMGIGRAGKRRIFASGGVGIAGDIFDQRIVEAMLLEHFGRGSRWGEDHSLFPDSYTDALANWQTTLELNRPEIMRFLQLVQLEGSHPARVRALESLLINNHVVRMFDCVEQAKVELSKHHFVLIRLSGQDMDIWQPLTRSQFETIIAAETAQIESCLRDTLSASGLGLGDIDAIVRTGGSSEIPRFIEMLGSIFGPDKVVLSSVFSGVTAGLAVRAYELSA